MDAKLVPVLNLADMPLGNVFGRSTSLLITLRQRTAEETINSVLNCFKLCISSSNSLKKNTLKENINHLDHISINICQIIY